MKAYMLLKRIYGKDELVEKVQKLVISTGMIIISTRRKKNMDDLNKIKELEETSNYLKRNLFRILVEIKLLSKYNKIN